MKRNISSSVEIKYRGPLAKADIKKLDMHFKQYGSFIKAAQENVFYFESTAFPSIGDFKWGVARVSIKCGKKNIHLRLKDGNAAAHKRQTFTVRVAKSQAVNLVYILDRLGMHEAFYRPVFRREYHYNNLIIIIKQRCVMGDHFEIKLKDDSPQALKELEWFLNKFRLRCWTQTQYKNRITKLMKTSPAIPILNASII